MRMEKSRLWICVIAAMITLSACGVSGERTSQVSSDTRQTSSEEASAVFWDNSAAASEVPTTPVAQTVLPTETVPPTLPTYPLVTKAPVTTAAPQGKMVVYWANTGDKIHIKPNCHTIKKGVLSGTLAEAKAAGREGWCGVCSKGWTDERFLKSGNPYAD